MKAAQMGGAGGHVPVPIVKDLVLLGGGHAHVEVLRSFGMQPLPGVRLTLVTKGVHTAYSGMLPGFVAQYYTFDECHIDLCRLAAFAQAHFVCATATRIDPQAQLVHLEGREPLAYDALSIDVGITPSGQGIPGALEHATPVKPVSSFVERLEAIRQRLQQPSDRPLQLAVVGGGAGGVELAMSLHQYATAGAAPGAAAASVTLLSRGTILASHPPAARRKVVRIMQEKGLTLREGCAVERVSSGKLELAGSDPLRFDACLWCTQAEAPGWFAHSSLPLDERGFLAIGETLQCAGGPPNVFAVGDCASCAAHPRPKAGVFAVRQGPPLAANLRRLLRGEPVQPFRPQRAFLSLITTGDRCAIATRSFLCLEGAYLWRWKDGIDRRFMARYGADLPAMQPPPLQLGLAGGPEQAAAVAAAAMRCGGCGAKVGAGALTRVLRRLPRQPGKGVVAGLEAPDDAAVVTPPPPGHLLVQTVDFLPSFVSDLREFGAVAANHALSDCHAMGAAPTTALATAVVPYGSEAAVERALLQLMAGASEALAAAGCALVGGHSCEGPQACLGFAVTGSAERSQLLLKGGARPGDALLLTKPLGSGVIMAAAMRGKALGRWVAGAIACMKLSSGDAAECLRQAGATACTDVTGFGLLGHLQEVAAASQVSVQLDPAAVPLLPGAAECSAAGVASSLLPQNARVSAWLAEPQQATALPLWPLLIDPQTGGGLLASVPAERAAACVEQLRGRGYPAAAIIGRVAARAEGGSDCPRPLIRLLGAT